MFLVMVEVVEVAAVRQAIAMVVLAKILISGLAFTLASSQVWHTGSECTSWRKHG